MAFDTFPIPDAAGQISEINARLLQQEALAGSIASPLGQALVSHLGYQDALQDKVQAKLQAVAGKQIAAQQAAVDGIQAKVLTAGAQPAPFPGGGGTASAPSFLAAPASGSGGQWYCITFDDYTHLINNQPTQYAKVAQFVDQQTADVYAWQWSHSIPGIGVGVANLIATPYNTFAEANLHCGQPAPTPAPPPPIPAPIPAPPPIQPPPPPGPALTTYTLWCGQDGNTYAAPDGQAPANPADTVVDSGLSNSTVSLRAGGPCGPTTAPSTNGQASSTPGAESCAVAPPVPDQAAPTDYCSRLDQLANYLSGIGKLWLAAQCEGTALRPEVVWSLSGWLLQPNEGSQDVTDLQDRLSTWLDKLCQCSYLQFWTEAVTAYYCDSQSRLPGLLAVRGIIDAIGSMEASWAWGGQDGKDVYERIGISLVGTGKGSESKWGWSLSDGTAGRIKLMLVPARELLDILIRRECPTESPGATDAVDGMLHSAIDEKTARCWAEAHGQVWSEYRKLLFSRSEAIRGFEVIQWGRRINAPPDVIDNALLGRGWWRDTDRAAIQMLYDRLPSVGETLNWFTHNVDDLADVLRSGKFAGFDSVDQCLLRWNELVAASGLPPPFTQAEAQALIQQWFDYMEKVGQGPTFVPRFGKDLADQGVADKVMTQNYLANWQLPPVTQLYEMAFRLRPGNVDKNLEFTDAQLKRYLAEWKFAPFWLDRLFAIARPAPNLTMVTQAFEVGRLTRQDYVGRLQDLGFSDVDAGLLADARTVVAVRKLTSAAHGWTPAALSSAYGAQTIDDKLVDDEMQRQGWDQDSIQRLKDRAQTDVRTQVVVRSRRRAVQTATAQVIASYKAGTITRDDAVPIMVGMGFNADTAGAVFDATDAAVYTGVVSKAVAALRRAFLHGELSLQQVQDQMVAIGITPERQQSYLQTWQVEFTAPRKALSTSKIVQLVTEGLLDVPTATQRLLNLGWQQPDILLQLAEAQQKIQARQAKATLAAQRSAKSAAAALTKAQKQAAQQARQLQGDLRRIMPVSRLKKWFLSGQVTEQFVIDRMLASGYTPQSIALYISEWAGQPTQGSAEYQKLIDKAQARMKGRFPLAELRKAFKAGAIDRTYIVQRLLQEGYSPQLSEILAGDVTGEVTQQVTAATAEVPPQ